MIDLKIEEITYAIADFINQSIGVECYQAQDNRVPISTGEFAIITPLFFERLSTTREKYNDTGSTATSSVDLTHVRTTNFQVDFYGSNAGNNCVELETIFRNWYGYDQFMDINDKVAPLYCSNAVQTTLIDSEGQWQNRYTITLTLQVHIKSTVPQAYFEKVEHTLENIDR